MRSLFKLSLAAMLALVVAGTAFAADVKWSGNIGAGFGQISYGKNDNGTATDAYSEFVTSYEANIRATVEAGPVTAIWRLRSRGHQSATTGSTEAGASGLTAPAGAAGLSYAEIWWKPTDAFSVAMGRFQGQNWSQPISGTYLILNPTTVKGVSSQNGAPEYFMNWTGIDGLDLEFNAGVVQVGLAIASECRPACVPAVAVSAQTMVPHITGKFGDIAIRGSFPQASGKDAIGGNSVTASGYQLGVSWSGMQGVYVGLDLQSFTNKEAAGSGTEDQVKTGMGLRVDFSGAQLGYWSGTTKGIGGVSGAEDKSTWIKLAYFMKVSDAASIIPEYTMASGTPDSAGAGKAVSNSLIRLVGNVTF